MGYIAIIIILLMLSLFFNGVLIVKNNALKTKIDIIEKDLKEIKND